MAGKFVTGLRSAATLRAVQQRQQQQQQQHNNNNNRSPKEKINVSIRWLPLPSTRNGLTYAWKKPQVKCRVRPPPPLSL
jgi:hypothetical protein